MSEARARPTAVSRRVRAFGPDDSLVGAVNDAQDDGSGVGAILWGLGVAELKTARYLAKKGVPSLQVRIAGSAFEDSIQRNALYSRHGIAFSRGAMDQLSAERGVESFILMGNCACASFCLNAAVADARVVGLILTNPYVSKRQLLSNSLTHKLWALDTWKRVFSGGIDWWPNLRAYRDALVDRFRGVVGRSVQPSADSARTVRPDFELPDNLDQELRELCDRGVSILIVCATGDDSMRYLPSRCGPVLTTLEAEGKLMFATVEGDTHVFSTDDGAAERLNEAISRWLESTTFCIR